MLYYITYAHLPNEKAFGYAISKMCSSFAAHEKVTLVISGLTGSNADIFSYYGIPENFTVRTLPALNLYKFKFLGTKIPFIVRKTSFFLSVLFLLPIKKDDISYSRDIWSAIVSRLKTKKVFVEFHYLSKTDAFVLSFLRAAQKVVVITHHLRKRLMTLGYQEKDILVFPSGTDLHPHEKSPSLRGELGLSASDKIIGYIGKYKTMGEAKGVEDLIAAFPGILSKIPTAFLLLVGIGENEYNEVEAIFSGLGIAKDRYKIVLHVPHAAAVSHMRASDVLVMNYPDRPHYRDVMSPIKLFEYMASGVPVATSDLPSIREVLDEKEAYFFAPDNRDALRASIIKVLENPEEAARVAAAASQKVTVYSWENRAAKVLQFMEHKK